MRTGRNPEGRQAGPAARSVCWPGLQRRLHLRGSGTAEVLAGLCAVLPDWHPEAAAPQAERPQTRVTAGRGGFRVVSDYLETPMTGLPVASAVCAVVADLAQSWAEERPDHLALHAAAVRSGAGLAVLAGPARAGKSTLVARLGLEPGWQVWGDDVLPLDPRGRAVALGILPRLRLPVPDAAGDALRHLAARACVLRDDRYGYIAVPWQARHGARAPVRVLIRLDRRPGAAPRLHGLPGTEAVRLLARQQIGGDGDGLPHLMRLAARVVALRLVYDALEPAVACLRAALSSPQALAALRPAAPLPEDPAEVVSAVPVSPGGMALPWQRIPGPVPRRLGDALVLWSPDTGQALALNPTAAALWRLLATPVTGQDVAAALHAAFPAEPPARIAADVAAALGAMESAGVIAPAPP